MRLLLSALLVVSASAQIITRYASVGYGVAAPLVVPRVASVIASPIRYPVAAPVVIPRVASVAYPVAAPLFAPRVASVSYPVAAPLLAPRVASVSYPVAAPVLVPRVASVFAPTVVAPSVVYPSFSSNVVASPSSVSRIVSILGGAPANSIASIYASAPATYSVAAPATTTWTASINTAPVVATQQFGASTVVASQSSQSFGVSNTAFSDVLYYCADFLTACGLQIQEPAAGQPVSSAISSAVYSCLSPWTTEWDSNDTCAIAWNTFAA